MSDIYKEIAKVLTKDSQQIYRGYNINKRSNSISATATEELLRKAKAKGSNIKKSIIGFRGSSIKDLKDLIDRELLANGLNDIKDAGLNVSSTYKYEYKVFSPTLSKKFYEGSNKNDAEKAFKQAVSKHPKEQINMTENDGYGVKYIKVQKLSKDESISKKNLRTVSEASKISIDKIEVNINSKGITEYFHKENGGLIGTWNPRAGKIEIKNWVRDSKGNVLKDEKGTKIAKYEKQGNVFIVKDIYGNVYEIGKSDIKWLEEKESQGKLRWGDIKSVGSLRRDLM